MKEPMNHCFMCTKTPVMWQKIYESINEAYL